VELKHAAYRGTQPAMLDLLGGNISAVSGPIGDITQHLPTGKVRILAVSGEPSAAASRPTCRPSPSRA
jgi:tripartite-type tricarboxylate transporter receptor subunit TctC